MKLNQGILDTEASARKIDALTLIPRRALGRQLTHLRSSSTTIATCNALIFPRSLRRYPDPSHSEARATRPWQPPQLRTYRLPPRKKAPPPANRARYLTKLGLSHPVTITGIGRPVAFAMPTWILLPYQNPWVLPSAQEEIPTSMPPSSATPG